MVAFCLSETSNQARASKADVDHVARVALARRLAELAGIDPDMLIPNSLDEEPIDGILPIGGPAHFAWREQWQRTSD